MPTLCSFRKPETERLRQLNGRLKLATELYLLAPEPFSQIL